MELIKRIEYSAQIDGTLKLLQNTSDAGVGGMIRWNGVDLQGFVNGAWVSLTGDISAIEHNALGSKQGGGLDDDFYHLSLFQYNNLIGISNNAYTQLAKIQNTVIEAYQWGLLGSLDQDVKSGSAPEFSNINLSSLTDGPLSVSGGFLSTTNKIDLDSQVSGILPIANGGTNSNAVLANGFVMISENGTIIESTVSVNILNLLDGITGITIGVGSPDINNDKLVTQGYVDKQIASIPKLTAENGLTISNEVIKFGGAITEDTYVFGAGHTLSFGNPMSSFSNISANADAYWLVANNSFEISSGSLSFTGMIYNNDFSANFVNRSIPDVEWVNNKVSNVISNLLLPIANGGTNSSTALVNGRVMISSFGKIVESSTITTTNLAVLSGITSVVTGTSNNNKFPTQGYVDSAISGLSGSYLPLTGGTVTGTTQFNEQLLIGGYSYLGANQVFTLNGNASTYYRNTYMAATPFGSLPFGPAIDGQVAGMVSGVGHAIGGMQLAGFTNSTGGAYAPVSITSYQGATAPSGAGFSLNACKSDGSTGRTYLADTEKIASFLTENNEKVYIQGDGKIVYNNDLAFINDLEVVNKKYVDNKINAYTWQNNSNPDLTVKGTILQGGFFTAEVIFRMKASTSTDTINIFTGLTEGYVDFDGFSQILLTDRVIPTTNTKFTISQFGARNSAYVSSDRSYGNLAGDGYRYVITSEFGGTYQSGTNSIPKISDGLTFAVSHDATFDPATTYVSVTLTGTIRGKVYA
ncbi:MAG: hypothetical protein M0R51_05380 [Clostridia bacterium]|jgi:hypothetical protein|nr:hypothetical protein [Clostridia bacterium]